MDVEVEGSVQSDGSLLAREVQPDEVTFTGSIAASLGGACPERTLSVDGRSVLTLATTRFDDITCSTLRALLRVEVRGIRRPDGSLLATRIRPQENRGRNDDDDDDDDDVDEDDDEIELRGSISGLNGACPSRSFSIGSQPVTTFARTRFDDVSCAALAIGMRVEVRGSRQPGGSILADRVKRED